MIESSFAAQYGIRLNRAYDMPWTEFSNLLSGLMTETPLGHIVSIRAEEDKDRLKGFNRDQHMIRSEWRSKVGKKLAKHMTEAEKKKAVSEIQLMFKKAFTKS